MQLPRITAVVSCVLLSLHLVSCQRSLPSEQTRPTESDFIAAVGSAAGAKAQNCGLVGLSEDKNNAIACAEAALHEGRAFLVVFAVQGIDSRLYEAVAVSETRKPQQFWYDSDISGGTGTSGKSIIKQRPCTSLTFSNASFRAIQCREQF
jgi:hypothetical protein